METALMQQQVEAFSSQPQTVNALCKQIEERRQLLKSKDLGPWPKSNPTASDISECTREMVLQVTNWQDRPPFTAAIRERLDRGTKIEDLVIQELRDIGYTIRQDRMPFEIRDKQGRLLCRGKVDGFIQIGRKDFPFEVKSLNPNIFNRIDSQEDFDQYIFFRKYPKQLLVYLYANNIEEGFFILDDCLGHQKLIPVKLDYERMEKILQQLESAVDHLAKKTLPDFHKDPAVCLKCHFFKRICTPPFFTGEGLQMINDPELEAKLNRRAELDPAATEYDRLDKELKEVFKGRDGLIIGNWLVSGEEKTRNYKAQTARETKYWQTTFERVDEPQDETE